MKFHIADANGRKVTTIDIEGPELRTLQAYAELQGLSLAAAIGKILEEELAREVARMHLQEPKR